MNRTFILLLFPILVCSQSETSNEDLAWSTNYDNALQKAQNEQKNLLVYFTGSDWCPPCKKLKKDFFETEEFKALSGEYVLLYVDLPRGRNLISSDQLMHNQKVLAKLNKRGVFPLITILTGKEKVLDELSGYNMAGDTNKHLKFIEKNKG